MTLSSVEKKKPLVSWLQHKGYKGGTQAGISTTMLILVLVFCPSTGTASLRFLSKDQRSLEISP